MGQREARLKAMLDPNGAWWQLNAEDREAIKWAFDRINTLEYDLERTREMRVEELNAGCKFRERFREIADQLRSALDGV
jgi:hypothetical protein